jgi:hypothetical protein
MRRHSRYLLMKHSFCYYTFWLCRETGILATQFYVWELWELAISVFAILLRFIVILKFWVKHMILPYRGEFDYALFPFIIRRNNRNPLRGAQYQQGSLEQEG